MFNAISTALAAFFSMFTRLCGAGEKAAGAIDHLAGWGEQSAATLEDEAKHDREINLEEAAFKRAQKKKQLAAQIAAADAETDAALTKANKKAVTAS